jgi:hypothetical protein
MHFTDRPLRSRASCRRRRTSLPTAFFTLNPLDQDRIVPLSNAVFSTGKPKLRPSWKLSLSSPWLSKNSLIRSARNPICEALVRTENMCAGEGTISGQTEESIAGSSLKRLWHLVLFALLRGFILAVQFHIADSSNMMLHQTKHRRRYTNIWLTCDRRRSRG